jgi:hypothetical protein
MEVRTGSGPVSFYVEGRAAFRAKRAPTPAQRKILFRLGSALIGDGGTAFACSRLGCRLAW